MQTTQCLWHDANYDMSRFGRPARCCEWVVWFAEFGHFHREDGPAIINLNSPGGQYWIRGVHIPTLSF